MANGGWYGTQEEWDRLEKPLLALDPIIEKFATTKNHTVTKNLRDWPERSITWGDDVRCLVQLNLADEKAITFNLWLCASQDRGPRRYWKREMPIKEKQIEVFAHSLHEHLSEGYQKLLEWSKNTHEMELAGELYKST